MTARFNVRRHRRDKHGFHLGQTRNDLDLPRPDMVAEIVHREKLSEVKRLAVVHVLGIDMHQTRSDELYPGAGEHIGLDSQVLDMDFLHARR